MDNLQPKDLKKLAKERLEDAEILFQAARLDGAFYICGYAVELSLKHKICETLEWDEYPTSRKESDKYKTFKTHDFEVLLHLSGVEKKVKTSLFTEWSVLMEWKSETRYSSQEKSTDEVNLMIEATKTLLEQL